MRIYIYACIHGYVYIHKFSYVHMYIYMHTYVFILMCLYMYLQVLARADKRLAKELATSGCFQLSPPFSRLGPKPQIHPMLANSPQTIG